MKDFKSLSESFVKKILTPDTHLVLPERLAPFPENELRPFEGLAKPAREKGLEILKNNQFARLILNGGMATRFGGVVKGICEVYEGLTFLDLKLRHMAALEAKWGIPEIPVALMNSSATAKATEDFLKSRNYFNRRFLLSFLQEDFPRLTPQGEIFQGSYGKDRAPRGHGDFLWALQDKGVFSAWKKQGITHFDFSNVDNLGATVDLGLIGDFIGLKKPMGVELAKKNPGDKGGAACLKDGIQGVLEGIYFHKSFNQDSLNFFNTNNLIFQVDPLVNLAKDPNFALPWNVVEKDVDGTKVIQFERIAIDTVFAFNTDPKHRNVVFYSVPREGQDGRFFPVKSPEDLLILRDKLKIRLGL